MENVNSRCYCWFRAPILVHQNGAPRWRPHTKLYKGEWNVSANNSETEGHKDLTLGQIVYKLVFYNISFSWFLPVEGFQVTFWLRDSENDLFLVFWPAFIKQSYPGAHQMEPPSPLLSWVNPFPSRFINRTACFPRKVSYFRESRMSPWKVEPDEIELRSPSFDRFPFFTIRPFLQFYNRRDLGVMK